MPQPRTTLRPIKIKRHFTRAAAGSVLIEMGRTRVLCTASFQKGVPKWREGSGLGWVTAEYSMLPASTTPRKERPRQGHTDSRGQEIQRLIGRSLRAVVDFAVLGENTITIDCDVLEADGGTRTASINGGYIALVDAFRWALKNKKLAQSPLRGAVAAVSVGLIGGKPALDLDYELDSNADVDLNVAMLDDGSFIEVQGTGEKTGFTRSQLDSLLRLAQKGIKQILTIQAKSLK